MKKIGKLLATAKKTFSSIWAKSSEYFKETLVNTITSIDSTKQTYDYIIELPGYSKKDLSIETIGDQVVISSNKSYRKEDSDTTQSIHEYFRYSFDIPQNSDANSIVAEMKKGLLTIKIPKLHEEKSTTRLIPVH